MAARAGLPAPPKHELAGADKLNTWYYGEAPKTYRPVLEIARRTATFEEVVKGLDERTAFTRRGGACPAAIASNATIATASVRITR